MSLYTKAELAKKTPSELKELVKEHDLEFEEDKPSKREIIEALMLIEEEDEDLDDELEDEEDELEEEDELDDEEEELDDEEDELEEEDVPAKPTKSAKKLTKKPASDENTLAAKQVATLLGTEAKTLRQFLRSSASTFEAVGSGGRYEFTEGDVPKIKKEFDAWRSAHAARGSKRGPGKGKNSTPVEALEEVEEIEELEELDDEIDDDDLELEDEED